MEADLQRGMSGKEWEGVEQTLRALCLSDSSILRTSPTAKPLSENAKLSARCLSVSNVLPFSTHPDFFFFFFFPLLSFFLSFLCCFLFFFFFRKLGKQSTLLVYFVNSSERGSYWSSKPVTLFWPCLPWITQDPPESPQDDECSVGLPLLLASGGDFTVAQCGRVLNRVACPAGYQCINCSQRYFFPLLSQGRFVVGLQLVKYE